MLTQSWSDALKKANAYRRQKKIRIGQQLNGEMYYLAMYKQGAGQTTNFDEENLNLGPLTGVRVWTNVESNGFNFTEEQVARDCIFRLFGESGHKKYKIVAGR